MREYILDAENLHYKILNEKIREIKKKGYNKIYIKNICGQRYIAAGLNDIKILIEGTPGNDLGAFMNGAEIYVYGNGQDGVGNTMNSGKIVIYGDAGDILGHSMRGGKIFVKGNVGYRVGIHMKSFKELFPVIVIGGCAKDFLGEYMAGGIVIVLNLFNEKVGEYIGTGMHGGEIFIRGKIENYQIGKEPKIFETKQEDLKFISAYINEFSDYFSYSLEEILNEKFYKLQPTTTRPYGTLYAY